MRRAILTIGFAVGFVLALSACNPEIDFMQSDAGGSHTCAVRADGTVACWGDNSYGQLGDGTNVDSTAPVAVTGIANAISISSGFNYTCAARSDNSVACWGANGSGQLGDGTIVDSSIPVTVTGLTNATSVAAGSSHTCAVRSDDSVACWGANGSGQLGDGTNTESSAPVTVAGRRVPGSSARSGQRRPGWGSASSVSGGVGC